MVLSNKKLKQRLRAKLAESVADTIIAKPEPTLPDPNSQPQKSLKHLIDSVTQKPRLSKREKRRKIQSLQGLNTVDNNNKSSGSNEVVRIDEVVKEAEAASDGGSDGEKKKKKKKRKRDDHIEEDVKEAEVASNGGGSDEVAKEVKKNEKAKKKEKYKKKNMNKKKKKKEAKSQAENSGCQQQGAVETEKNGERSEVNEEVATKVYVGGIPYYSNEDDIRSYFEGCGSITEVDCMKFPDSGKFRGIAIINFKTEGAAKRALALDGSEMGELSLKIQPYKTTKAHKSSDFAPKVVEGYNRIYAGNLSWDITEDDLRKLFSDCKISSIRWGMNKETEEFLGFAHVDFSDSLSLMMALKLDQRIVCGRPVKISCAVPMKEAKTRSKSVPSGKGADTGALNSVHPSEGADAGAWNSAHTSEVADPSGLVAGSGKMRRRTCYECGGKGHLFSACPNKQPAGPSILNTN
ncbi:RRM_1 domain-containing protein [Cephalotus follicularis]|uniref:RRM_1 domain-containing protein n=1 Tax=Cephalotus follicularis TaxID=3775 RepID=A0A1Q3C762_CEPFO|nr:RRM_1 domain-containing protein [Cephalotus follicularis]